jgi:hypothetical protein
METQNGVRLNVMPAANRLNVFLEGPVGKIVRVNTNGYTGVGVEVPLK